MSKLEELFGTVKSIMSSLISYRGALEKALGSGEMVLMKKNLNHIRTADECIEGLAESLYDLSDMLNDGKEDEFMNMFEEFISNRKHW